MDAADLRLRRLAVTWVNHAGAPLVKVVPWSRRQEAISTGVGFSPVSDAFRADGVIAADHRCACPDGDLRLHAVAEMVSPLIPAQGWAWAPGERRWRDGCPYDADQRWFCRRQQEQLQEVAVELSAGFELEWAVASTAAHRPAFAGGPYGADRLMECLDYAWIRAGVGRGQHSGTQARVCRRSLRRGSADGGPGLRHGIAGCPRCS